MNIEAALRELEVAFPPEPEVAARVAARLRRPRWRRRPWTLALAAAVAALAVAFAVPPARSAILELLGLRGVTIERVPEQPVFDQQTGRRLGMPTTLAEAARRAPFELLVPSGYGEVLYDPDIPAVTFAWNDRRLFLTEFRGETIPFIEKFTGPGTSVEPVRVNGGPGYWITGEVHSVVFRTEDGTVLESRAAGNVLLWEQGGITLRLEGARTKAEALRTAGTLRAVAG